MDGCFEIRWLLVDFGLLWACVLRSFVLLVLVLFCVDTFVYTLVVGLYLYFILVWLVCCGCILMGSAGTGWGCCFGAFVCFDCVNLVCLAFRLQLEGFRSGIVAFMYCS